MKKSEDNEKNVFLSAKETNALSAERPDAASDVILAKVTGGAASSEADASLAEFIGRTFLYRKTTGGTSISTVVGVSSDGKLEMANGDLVSASRLIQESGA